MRLAPVRIRKEVPSGAPLVDVLLKDAMVRFTIGADVEDVAALAMAHTPRC